MLWITDNLYYNKHACYALFALNRPVYKKCLPHTAFDVIPGANMEQGEDTTPDMTDNADDHTPEGNFESFLDSGVMNLPEAQASSKSIWDII